MKRLGAAEGLGPSTRKTPPAARDFAKGGSPTAAHIPSASAPRASGRIFRKSGAGPHIMFIVSNPGERGSPEPIGIVLVDDHELFSYCLWEVLKKEEDFNLLTVLREGSQVLAAVEKLDPDIVLLDVEMPDMSGFEVANALVQNQARCRVIMLSAHEDVDSLRRALKSGAKGYVAKTSEISELVHGIRTVERGHLFVSSSLSDHVISSFVMGEAASTESSDQGAGSPLRTLTKREHEVLLLMAEGYSTPQIGAHLLISPRTIEVHRASVMRKLGLASQTAVVRFAIEHGLIALKKK